MALLDELVSTLFAGLLAELGAELVSELLEAGVGCEAVVLLVGDSEMPAPSGISGVCVSSELLDCISSANSELLELISLSGL